MLTAAAATPGRQSLAARSDALALSIGARVTGSTLILACVLTIALGAASMLNALKSMDSSLQEMVEQVALTEQGTVLLDEAMDSLPPSAESLTAVTKTVKTTGGEVATSRKAIDSLAADTQKMSDDLAGIATGTAALDSSIGEVAATTGQLSETVTGLDKQLGPLVQTQSKMRRQTTVMRGGICAMNGSLASVVRMLNYLTAPPTGRGFTVRVELDKKALPGPVKATADPVQVFQRGAWPVYNETGGSPC